MNKAKKNTVLKLAAAVLCLAILLSAAPITAAAGDIPNNPVGEIMSFAPLDWGVINQIVPFGTQQWELNLPPTLEVTVMVHIASGIDADFAPAVRFPRLRSLLSLFGAVTVHAAEIGDDTGDEDNPPANGHDNANDSHHEPGGYDPDPPTDPPPDIPHTPATPGDLPQIITIHIPVTWQAAPEFDGTEGVYVFFPVIEGYTISPAAQVPVITVTVEPEEIVQPEIFGFEPLPQDVAYQIVPFGATIYQLILPETLWALVENATMPVTATWESHPLFDGTTEGVYVFFPRVELAEGYTISPAVQLPTITVTVEPEEIVLTEISGFEPLPQDVAYQIVPFGTTVYELILPEIIMALVGSEPGDLTAMPVMVTWQAQPIFDGTAEGVYVFIPLIEDFAIRPFAQMPTITVIVEPLEIPQVFMLPVVTNEVAWVRINSNYEIAPNGKQFNARAYNGNGVHMPEITLFTWSLHSANGMDLSSLGISIDGNGLLTVPANINTEIEFYVRATYSP